MRLDDQQCTVPLGEEELRILAGIEGGIEFPEIIDLERHPNEADKLTCRVFQGLRQGEHPFVGNPSLERCGDVGAAIGVVPMEGEIVPVSDVGGLHRELQGVGEHGAGAVNHDDRPDLGRVAGIVLEQIVELPLTHGFNSAPGVYCFGNGGDGAVSFPQGTVCVFL